MAEDLEEHAKTALLQKNSYLENPINAFQLIKKITLDWQRTVSSVINNNTWEKMFREFKQNRVDWPSFVDLIEAAKGLMRLQVIYELDTSQIIEGLLPGRKSPELTEDDCYEMGQLAFESSDFHQTALWMEQTLKKRKKNMQKSGECDDKKCADIMDYLAHSYFKMNNIPEALKLTNEVLSIDPHHERAINNKGYFEAMMEVWGQKEKVSKETTLNESLVAKSDMVYSALCREEQVRVTSAKYTCRYVTKNNPLLILQPAKEETMHLDPWIVTFHDILSESQIDALKRLAKPGLEDSEVMDDQGISQKKHDTRSTQVSWLVFDDEVDPILTRIEAIIRLDMWSSEPLQVANYGVGGHYTPHYDHVSDNEEEPFKNVERGNRIATLLLYLSDVETGGATVFTELGLKVVPKKGSGVFWYNLLSNGKSDDRTRHGACPVLMGSKWVANSWIHERGQEFLRPCQLNPNE